MAEGGLLPFHHLFPEIGISETPSMKASKKGLPEAVYAFVEHYCVDPECDCRRAVLAVFSHKTHRQVATINHAFDEERAHPKLGRTFLDPINPQSLYSRILLDLFMQDFLANKPYVALLEKHYRMVKRAVADPGHSIHARLAELRGEKSSPWESARRETSGGGPVPPRRRGMESKKAAPNSNRRGPEPNPAVPLRATSRDAAGKSVHVEPAVVVVEVPRIDIPQVGAVDVRNASSDWTSWIPALDAPGDPREVFLRIDYERLKLQGEFEDLLAPAVLPNIEKYWFQIETVRKVLRRFHGRVLLADEVGLGKTIEAGLLIKEYLLRGLARRVLILAPSSLVSQWREEMHSKFDLAFETTDHRVGEGLLFARDPRGFWSGNFIIASLHTAKMRKHADSVAAESFDIVVVDEAHHLRNRGTLAWQLVNRLQKRFLFLLSATPVQNNLVELFNLITLLKPGLFQTESVFRREYMAKGTGAPGSNRNGRDRVPANKEKLRELLRDVMIRNTRSAIDLKMTKRYATTIRVDPTEAEATVLRELEVMIRAGLASGALRRPSAELLLREAGSSPFALPGTLERMKISSPELAVAPVLAAVGAMATRLGERSAKETALLELLDRNSQARQPGEKILIFFQFLKSMDRIAARLEETGRSFTTFRGDMSGPEKDAAIARFRGDVPDASVPGASNRQASVSILLASESGGEGRNLQFANTLVNFDLPWNPMRIEQRIGRIHRIGQTRDVFVFNLAVRGTIEDHVLEILESKINMFEMVIGEIEPILGRLSEKRGQARLGDDGRDLDGQDREPEFEDLIFDLWVSATDARERTLAFEKLGDEMVAARAEYLEGKKLDEEIFGEAFES